MVSRLPWAWRGESAPEIFIGRPGAAHACRPALEKADVSQIRDYQWRTVTSGLWGKANPAANSALSSGAGGAVALAPRLASTPLRTSGAARSRTLTLVPLARSEPAHLGEGLELKLWPGSTPRPHAMKLEWE